MKRKWMILLMILSLAVKIKGGTFEKMMISLNSLHRKVDKLSLEQVKTNKKVDQLQRKIESLEAKIDLGFNGTLDIMDIDIDVDYMPMNGTVELDITNSTRVAILVTGGNPLVGHVPSVHAASKSVEALNYDGTPLCTLPNLPDHTRLHTMDGNILCDDESCQRFEFGMWKKFSWNLRKERRQHLSWKSPKGEIHLLGGGPWEHKTTEIVTSRGSKPGFNLRLEQKLGCVIGLENSFIITGGAPNNRGVFEYNHYSNLTIHAPLNTGRKLHGCGSFYSSSNELVLLVAGGVDVMMDSFASVEIKSESEKNWRFAADLPGPRSCMRGVTVVNQLFMTGGTYDNLEPLDDIISYDPDADRWVQVGSLTVARSSHAVSVLPLEEVEPFCLS